MRRLGGPGVGRDADGSEVEERTGAVDVDVGARRVAPDRRQGPASAAGSSAGTSSSSVAGSGSAPSVAGSGSSAGASSAARGRVRSGRLVLRLRRQVLGVAERRSLAEVGPARRRTRRLRSAPSAPARVLRRARLAAAGSAAASAVASGAESASGSGSAAASGAAAAAGAETVAGASMSKSEPTPLMSTSVLGVDVVALAGAGPGSGSVAAAVASGCGSSSAASATGCVSATGSVSGSVSGSAGAAAAGAAGAGWAAGASRSNSDPRLDRSASVVGVEVVPPAAGVPVTVSDGAALVAAAASASGSAPARARALTRPGAATLRSSGRLGGGDVEERATATEVGGRRCGRLLLRGRRSGLRRGPGLRSGLRLRRRTEVEERSTGAQVGRGLLGRRCLRRLCRLSSLGLRRLRLRRRGRGAGAGVSNSEPPDSAGAAAFASGAGVSKSEPPDSAGFAGVSGAGVSNSEPDEPGEPDEPDEPEESAGVSNSDEPPEAFAAGPASAVSVTVSSVMVTSPASGSSLVATSVVAAAAAGAAAGGRSGRRLGRRLALHRGEQHLRDVEDLDLLAGLALGLLGGEAVGEHHAAERAADRDLVGAGADGLLGAVDVDPLAEVLLHPHARATGAAAEGPLGVALHLDELGAGQHLEQLARRRVDLVVAAEVAGVVVGDRALRGARAVLDRRQLALAHEAVEQLRVVHDLELDAEVLVLVLERVEAVGAGRDDLLDLVLLEGLDVLLRQALEDELVAGAAGRVAGAGLAVAEYAEARRRPCRAARRRRGWSSWRGPRRRRRSRPRTASRPTRATRGPRRRRGRRTPGPWPSPCRPDGRHVPRVALVLQALEEPVELGREVRLDQHLVAAHVHDVVDVLDVDGALLDAGAARGAGPEHVLVDDEVAALGVVERSRARRCPSTGRLALRARRRRSGALGVAPRRRRPWRRRGRAGR